MTDDDKYEFTEGQAKAMEALRSGRNVFLTGNAGTGKSFVLNAFIEELEDNDVPFLAMAPTGIAAQNLENGTTIHRTLQIGFGLLDPEDRNRKTLTRKVLNKAVKQAGFDDYKAMLAGWDEVLTEVMRQNDPEFIDQLNRARVGDRGCVAYFNERSISDRKRAPENDLWLCATNRMASTINDERVSALEVDGAQARTYVASVSGDVKPSDKPTDDKLRLIEGARVMLLANMPDDGLANGSLGTVVETGIGSVTVLFDDTGLEVEIEPKQWKVMKTTVHESIGKDGKPVQELENDVVGTFTQIPLRLAFAITIHKSQGQTFERCAVHSKVFGAGMLYVALSRCTTFDGLTVWPKIESSKLYANQSVIDFYRSLEQQTEEVKPAQMTIEETTADDMVTLRCPRSIAERVQGYIDALVQGNAGQ